MKPTQITAITVPANQAKGRHLLDGSLPSGNSRIMYIPSNPTGGTHNQRNSASSVTEDVTVPVVASWYALCCSPKTIHIQKRPVIRQIQPIGFPGRLEAIRTPTIGKDRKGAKI